MGAILALLAVFILGPLVFKIGLVLLPILLPLAILSGMVALSNEMVESPKLAWGVGGLAYLIVTGGFTVGLLNGRVMDIGDWVVVVGSTTLFAYCTKRAFDLKCNYGVLGTKFMRFVLGEVND